MRYIIIILFVLSTQLLFAQTNTPENDIIVLRNNSKLEGEITAMNKKEVLLKVGTISYTIQKSEIARIFPKGQSIEFLLPNKDVDKTVSNLLKNPAKLGLYNISYGSFIEGERIRESGLAIDNISGIQLNQHFGLGLGLGYHNYAPQSGQNIVPFFLDFRGYFNQKKVSPYYVLDIGYSFAFKNKEFLITDASGGVFFHPAIGYKVGSDEAAFMIDLGLEIAEATWTYDYIWERTVNKMQYNRLVLRIGIML